MENLAFIDLYCERTGAGFWNEPLNALSNVAFPLAALWVLPAALGRPKRDVLELGLIALAGLIGVGSFLFHTLANPAAELADVIPIWSFVALFVLTVIYRSTQQDILRTLWIATIAVLMTGAIVWFTGRDVTTDTGDMPGVLNGSLQYLPALSALVVFTTVTQRNGHPARHLVLTATLIFMVSLGMRTIDLSLCGATGGVGTHFIWHVLNALMIGLLLQVLVHHLPPLGDGHEIQRKDTP